MGAVRVRSSWCWEAGRQGCAAGACERLSLLCGWVMAVTWRSMALSLTSRSDPCRGIVLPAVVPTDAGGTRDTGSAASLAQCTQEDDSTSLRRAAGTVAQPPPPPSPPVIDHQQSSSTFSTNSGLSEIPYPACRVTAAGEASPGLIRPLPLSNGWRPKARGVAAVGVGDVLPGG